MKKTLVALAALAATGAFAQSSVQIDGNFDGGLVNYNYAGTKATGIDKNITATSQINFRGTNDLGGGMSAFWHVETDLSPVNGLDNQGNNVVVSSATGVTGASGTLVPASKVTQNTSGQGVVTSSLPGTTFGNGDLSFGVQGGFGKVAFGNINNFSLYQTFVDQPFYTAFGSAFRITSGAVFASAVRDNNTVQYVSPAFGGGFTVGWMGRTQQALSGTGGTAGASASPAVASPFTAAPNTISGSNVANAGNSQSRVSSLAVMYSNGPLNAQATFATDDARNTAYVNNVLNAATGSAPVLGNVGQYNAIGANYTFGAFKVMGGYANNKLTNNNAGISGSLNGLTASLVYTAGANMFAATYANLKQGGSFSAGYSDSTLGLGYEYALSKTTALTARYEKITDQIGLAYSALDPQATGYGAGTNSNRTRIGAGIRVGF